MGKEEFNPRLSVEIREDQYWKLRDILPHGTQKVIFHALIDGIIAIHTRGGFEALAPILSGHLDVIQLAKAGKEYTHSIIKE